MAVKVQPKLAFSAVQAPEIIDSDFDFDEVEASPAEQIGGFQPAKAVEIDSKYKTPEFPNKTIKTKDSHMFWEWLDSLNAEDWTKINVYCYRQWPLINKRLTDPSANTNISKYMDRFTEEHVKEDHGSGIYKFMVNDSSKTVNGKGGRVGEATVEINDPSYPPNLDLSEVVIGHPSNRSYVEQLRRDGKLDKDNNIVVNNQNQNQTTNNDGLIDLIKELVRNQARQVIQPPSKDTTAEAITSMMMKTHEQSLNLVKDQIKGDDPEKLVKLITVLAAMKETSGKSDGTMEMFMKMQLEMNKVQAESAASREALMLKLMESMKPIPQEDTFDKELDRMVKLKELMGDGDSGGRSSKKSTLETVIEHGAPILGKVLEGVFQFISVQNYAKGVAMQPTPQTQPQQPTLQQGDNIVEMPTRPVSPLVQYGGMILNALQRGIPGDQFAESVETMVGPLVYNQIASAGKDNILTEMKGVPEFWDQVKAFEPMLDKFVADFIAWGNEDAPEEEEK